MAIKKVPVVAPFDLGRGIKRRDDIAKFEVDLTQYVDNKTVVYSGGKLSTIAPCARATNLNYLDASEGTLKKLGITCFYGSVAYDSDSSTIGVPVKIGQTDSESSKASTRAIETPKGVELDFNGWQIATDAEVTQYLYTGTTDGKQSGWTRSNEAGMNPNGELKDSGAWSNWMYELNLPSKPILVSTAGAIEGDGSTTNPIKLEFDDTIVKSPDGRYGAVVKVKAVKEADGKVVITNQDGSTVEIEKSAAATAGLDCAAIDALPERPWKKGTVLLAKQDGECVRLAAFDSIFQEVGVGITADKTNSFTNEEYKVVVTVSNTGEGKNELTNLNIVGPANTEDYEIKDVTFTKSEADAVEQVDNLTYNIRGLKKGGTVKVKYTVVPKVLGNYQFTAAVNPNSALDKDLGNNNATLILNARTKSDPTYVPSVDCPLITATDVTTGKQLVQLSSVDFAGKRRAPWVGRYLNFSNALSDRTTLKGTTIKFSAECTVIARYFNMTPQRFDNSQNPSNVIIGSDGVVYQGTWLDTLTPEDARNTGNSVPMSVDSRDEIKSYTPLDASLSTTDNKSFTIDSDARAIFIAVRPRGENCRWQLFSLVAKHPEPKYLEIAVSDEVNLTYSRVPMINFDKVGNTAGSDNLSTNIVTGDIIKLVASREGVIQKTIINVRAGEQASAKLDVPGGLSVVGTSGLVTITRTGVTVSADAKPTDSIRSTYLDVIIEE